MISLLKATVSKGKRWNPRAIPQRPKQARGSFFQHSSQLSAFSFQPVIGSLAAGS